MLALFLLVPLVAAVPLPPEENFIVDIEDGTLKSVQPTGTPVPALDLSGRKLRALESNALDSLGDLTSLNLSNNELSGLPEFVFSNLTKLESLSLAQNKLSDLRHLFVGLESLRTLNISHNPVLHLRRGHLFGLTKSVTVYTEGNKFWSLSTGAFTNVFLKDEEQQPKEVEPKQVADPQDDQAQADEASMLGKDDGQRDMEAVQYMMQNEKEAKELDEDVRLKLCTDDGTVTSLDFLTKEESLLPGCQEVPLERKQRTVSLRALGIKGFQEGWYKLRGLPVATLDLSNNEISEITKETLNELPRNIVYVNLLENRIRRIWSQVIDNPHLRMINLKGNILEDIEEGALLKTNLTGLFLTGNQLENLNFVASLPDTLSEFVVTENQITAVAAGAFSKLRRLAYLNMASNRIKRLQNSAFDGLDSLQVLILTKNGLEEIEPEAFKNLKQLTMLYLYRNALTDFKSGALAGLENLKDLNLAYNKLSKVEKDTFSDLPKTLDFLHLDNNEIESVESGSFAEVPRFTLSANNNKLTSIPRGAFNLPTLRDLHLNNNSFASIDGDSYEGLPQLKRLWLSENKITEIRKGACKHLGSLNILDISKNPFTRLENGALYGLSPAKGNFVYLYTNQLKEMEGGIFDDA